MFRRMFDQGESITKRDMGLESGSPCSMYADMDKTEIYNTQGNCPATEGHINGTFELHEFSYISVEFLKCDILENPNCKNDTEISKIFNSGRVVLMLDTYATGVRISDMILLFMLVLL